MCTRSHDLNRYTVGLVGRFARGEPMREEEVAAVSLSMDDFRTAVIEAHREIDAIDAEPPGE